MSKYSSLWIWISETKSQDFKLTYEELEKVLNFKIDHSFLTFKKELEDYGFKVEKISLKNKEIYFKKL
ncbi:MAG: hypothetical protein MJZ37_07705 [Bacilli bacterium]|nr:hypothetical protein [Bacilli bacterium]